VSFSDDEEGDMDMADAHPPRQTRPDPPASSTRAPKRTETESPPASYRRPRSPAHDDVDIAGGSGIASLFSLISRFRPEPVELSVHWKPFIPDLVPAIGTIDAFIKIPRPDGVFDDLGLVIVDEPSITQSNPQVLRMELREQYGISSPSNTGDCYIGFLEDPHRDRKALDSWLASIEDIHRNRPPPAIIYSHKMPEMEELMEVWAPKFEETLNSIPLPASDIDLDFDDYARVLCALLDIPVKGNLIESLHHLFTLYSTFARTFYLPEAPQ
jgi:intraflagellar transport protein 46